MGPGPRARVQPIATLKKNRPGAAVALPRAFPESSSMRSMNVAPDILTRILRRKLEEITRRRGQKSLHDVRRGAEAAPPPRDCVGAMTRRLSQGQSAVIAEMKRASPSRGVLRADLIPAEIAQSFESNGAACLSVLTDADFHGADDDLKRAREACTLPVLRKDFIIDPYQVYEARAIGADCILLIVAALPDLALATLSALAHRLGMSVLVEVHDRAELSRALALSTPLIGVNNRDLRSFATNLNTTLELRAAIPAGRIVVAESGIHTKEDVLSLRQAGVDAFLVGEAFMKAARPGEELRRLFAADPASPSRQGHLQDCVG
jgi:indole-3-glycerol phosphate synthase